MPSSALKYTTHVACTSRARRPLYEAGTPRQEDHRPRGRALPAGDSLGRASQQHPAFCQGVQVVRELFIICLDYYFVQKLTVFS